MRRAIPIPPSHRRPGRPRLRFVVAACALAVAACGAALAQTTALPHDPFAPVAGNGGASTAAAAAAAAAAKPAAAAPAASSPPVARPLVVHSGALTLAGTLLLPPGSGPFPAVVLLAGSTPADLQRAAADARMFAASGVAAYSYAVRGETSTSNGWRDALSVEDAVGQAVAAVGAVRRQPGIDPQRVGVWGVGQGAWLAPFVGEHADVAFLILLNTSAASLGQEEVWRAGQTVRSRGYSRAAADAAMRSVRLLVATRPVLAALLPPGELGFLGSNPARTPADALANTHAPALLVFNDLDPHAPGVKTTAKLLRTAQQRDQPLDHVTALGLPAGDSAPAARQAAEATYRSVVVGWTTTVLGVAAGAGTAGTTVPAALLGTTGAAAAGPTPPSDPSLLLPGTSDRPPPWYASPWVQLAAVVFFLIAFGLGVVLSLVPHRRSAAGGTDLDAGIANDAGERARLSNARVSNAHLLRLAQGLVSVVDLLLLVGSTLAIAYLLGLYSPTGLALEPLAVGLRALSAISGALAVGLAALLLLARRNRTLPPRPAVAVVVALAAALFLPFLVYWQVPFLAG